MARPPKPADERRTTIAPFKIRASETERAAWDAAADPQPTGTWARDVLNQAAERHNKTLKPTGRKRPSA